MAQPTLKQMIDAGLLGIMRAYQSGQETIDFVLGKMLDKFPTASARTVQGAINMASNSMNAALNSMTNYFTGSIPLNQIPRITGLPARFRWIVRVQISCVGQSKPIYATVYVDTDSRLTTEMAMNRAMSAQLQKWFGGMGLRAIDEDIVCGEPSAEVTNILQSR